MSQTHTFLLELGIEELPAQALQRMTEILEKSFKIQLHEAQLNFSELTMFATPRRLAVLIMQIDARQKDETVLVRGPSVKAAYDSNGVAKGPAIGFAASCGVGVEQLERVSSKKGEYLAYNQFKKGNTLFELLPGFIEQAVKELAASKTMRWGIALHRFLRPLRWVTALVDTEVLACEVYGLQADRFTYGHRVHAPKPISLTHAAEYEPRLQSLGYVVPQFSIRRQTIADQIDLVAVSQNLIATPSEALLDEITGLVEWPVTLLGTFDESFLEVPHECLISTMEKNQKYIALHGRDGRLANAFLFVANIESQDAKQVIQGNERVIRPRFADAKFFYDADKAKLLVDLRQELSRVIYQKELGSILEKTDRMAFFAQSLAEVLNVDRNKCRLIGELSKVDLLTAMVGEFPELQGIMGRYYAVAQGFDEDVAQALEEQYLPRGQGDSLPNSGLGIALSLADKFDALVGLFSIGKEPSADKDPFALRRMALGVVRMCIELELNLDVLKLAEIALDGYGNLNLDTSKVSKSVALFIMQRLPTLYKDSGIDMRLVRAVEALNIYNPSDFNKRLVVLQQFYNGNDANALAEVHKRVNNILKKNSVNEQAKIEPNAFTAPAEKQLYNALERIQPKLKVARENADYAAILQLGASLRADVDLFFIEVKVMSDLDIERDNRLIILMQLRDLLAEVGDLSFLA